MITNRNTVYGFSILIVSLFLMFMLNLWYGSVVIPVSDVWAALSGGKTDTHFRVIVAEYRLPQAITAMATGMSLGLAGLLLQSLFRNPLAGPSVLGISAGASFGVAFVLLTSTLTGISIMNSTGLIGDLLIVMAALAGALIILLLILYVSKRIGNVVTILIIGIMIGYAVSALVGVMQFFSRAEDLHAYVLWGLGSFSKTGINQSVYLLVAGLVVMAASAFLIKPLNAILMGVNYARSVGINTHRLQTVVILIAGMLIAVTTAFTGPIAFIGLAVPHLARNLFRTANHGVLLPSVVLIGGALTLMCNLIAKLPGYDTSLPINAVTSLIGAPIVVWVIVRKRRFNR